MDRILKILKKENGPRASSSPCTGVKYHNIQTCLLVYARLQDHWSSGLLSFYHLFYYFFKHYQEKILKYYLQRFMSQSKIIARKM